MVRLVHLIASIALCSASLLAHAEQLLLEIQNPHTELGLPIIADLYAVSSKHNLNHIDLQPLQNNYDVVIRQNAEDIEDPRWPGESVQRLRLELYPSRTGEQIVPAVTLGQSRSTTHSVHISDGKTRQGPIRVSSNVSSTTVWQRQQLLITMTVTTPDRYATLQADSPVIHNVEVIPLPQRREFNAEGGSTLQIGWALFPLSDGEHEMKLPAINYRLSGVVKRRYYLPPVAIRVKPLPTYLPPTIPVGRIELSSNIAPHTVLQPQRLSFWQIRLQGDNVLPLWMPPVLRQLRSDQNITFSPAKSERRIEHTSSGVQSHVFYEVPFKFTGTGYGMLPGIRVQYFDPDTARIETVHLQPIALWVIGAGWHVFVAILLLPLIILGITKMRTRWVQWRQHLHARRSALAGINASDNIDTLRNAVRQFAGAENWPENLSLSDWLAHWNEHYTGDDEVPLLINELSQLSYGHKQGSDFDGLKAQLYAAILKARPRKRKWYSLTA